MFTIFDKDLQTTLFALGNKRYLVLYVNETSIWQVGKLLTLDCYRYDSSCIDSEDFVVVERRYWNT